VLLELPNGFFNVYSCLANRDDLDAIVHVGDYIYEFQNGVYGDGAPLYRIPEPSARRSRSATTGSAMLPTEPIRILQRAHAHHPFIVVWDDHEITNDAWSGGAANHKPRRGRLAHPQSGRLPRVPGMDADRESAKASISTEASVSGTLAHLVMLDTRGLRDQQVLASDIAGLTRESRTTGSATRSRSGFFDELRSSQRAGLNWRIVGQQVLFSRLGPCPAARWCSRTPGTDNQAARDFGDGLRRARADPGPCDSCRRHPQLVGHGRAAQRVGRLTTAAAVRAPWLWKIVAPAISSPPLSIDPILRQGEPGLRASLPHLKFLEGESNGYVVLDVTKERLQSDWYFVSSITTRSDAEKRAMRLVCERGSSRLMT
jgi:alkaline phosphatase D